MPAIIFRTAVITICWSMQMSRSIPTNRFRRTNLTCTLAQVKPRRVLSCRPANIPCNWFWATPATIPSIRRSFQRRSPSGSSRIRTGTEGHQDAGRRRLRWRVFGAMEPEDADVGDQDNDRGRSCQIRFVADGIVSRNRFRAALAAGPYLASIWSTSTALVPSCRMLALWVSYEFLAEAIIRPITNAAMVARKPAPRRMASLEAPSSSSGGNDLFRIIPTAVPIRIETNDATKAIAELIAWSLCFSLRAE